MIALFSEEFGVAQEQNVIMMPAMNLYRQQPQSQIIKGLAVTVTKMREWACGASQPMAVVMARVKRNVKS